MQHVMKGVSTPFAEISSYLSFGALLIGGIHEDASVGDGAVDV